MTFILVPHQVTDTAATIWVGVANEDGYGRQRVMGVEVDDGTGSRTVELDASGWETWRSYSPGDEAHYAWPDRLLDRVLMVLKRPPIIRTLDHRRVPLDNLKPRTSYSLRLHVEGRAATGPERHLREARITTLPATLPGRDQKAFTVLLGSCFYGPNDEDGMVGKTYYHLPGARRPDIKILCGDQVYLDNPWLETSLRYNGGNVRRGLFRAGFFQKYLDNWTQLEGEDAGFRQLLKDGANFFCSDDHEYWNNAPNFGGLGFINTLNAGQRDWWRGEARKLFRIFQSPDPLIPFDVGRLSFCIADTRINRSITPERFMDDEDLRAVGRWIEGLGGPGVLVVGQPVLAEATGRGKRADWNKTLWSALDRNLADYAQYETLVGYIKASAHSLVVFSGDVHFGRVACVRPDPSLPDAKFVEVISSPMQLVTVKSKLLQLATRTFGSYKEPPTHRFAITDSQQLAPKRNHFVTVEFSLTEEGKVNMTAWSWPIPESEQDAPTDSNPVFEAILS